MTTKEKLMAAAFACVVTPVAYAVELDVIPLLGGGPGDSALIDGNTVVKGTALVNDTLTVQPETTTVVDPTVVTPGSGVATDLGGIIGGTGGDVKLVETILNTNEAEQTTVTGGGFVAETNGDATLLATTAENTSVNYGRTVTQEIAQAGNVNPVGVAIPGTEAYYLTNADTGAQISGPYATEGDLDAFIALQTPATILLLDPTIGETVALVGSGGNLQVGGTGNVDGVLSVGDNGAGGVADVDAAINGNAAGIVTNAADIV
ncbi:MAG: hypothetical protein OSA84_13195, partial [Akkermansiaceae bacterium]|nr:hypothetical protein [Akkermansiaceae bacterium]